MAISAADLRLVDPVAANLTPSVVGYPSPALVRVLKLLVLVPLWFVVVADASPTPTPPSPSPCPVFANPPVISLSPAAGRAAAKITATGIQFDCRTVISLYWDSKDHPAGQATTNNSGSFTAPNLTVFAGAKPGTHRLCADVPQNPCANFTLQPPPTPSPRTSSSPRTSPSPSPSPSQSPSPFPLPTDNTPTALDILTRPPFVFFPIIAILGLIGAVAYWALSNVNRQRPAANLPTASVVHRSARPDMGPVGPPPPPAPMQPPPPGLAPPQSPPEDPPGGSATGPQEPPHLD